jgi:DNA modification methylase
MKPVGLYVNALLNNSEPGDFAIDPFAGSGTMLIACEQTNRKAVCIELTEKFTDVIVQRWVNFTGGKVILNGKEIEWQKTT